ncbi:imelysin family protein, partial [Vibrio sp. 1580]
MNAKTVLVQSIAASLLIASGTTVAAQVTKQQVVEHYADVAHAVFADSLTTAKTLEVKIDEFLKAPSEAKLEDVKQAWLESRVPYQQSEVFRFGNAVVDD